MVESKRKKEESFESFLRRFNKRLLQSGKLYEVRQAQHVVPTKSRNLQKKSALISRKYRLKNDYLRKIGKLKDETKNRW